MLNIWLMFNKDLSEVGLSQASSRPPHTVKVVTDYKPIAPTLKQVVTAYTSTPLQVEDYAGNPILEHSPKTIQRRKLSALIKLLVMAFYVAKLTPK